MLKQLQRLVINELGLFWDYERGTPCRIKNRVNLRTSDHWVWMPHCLHVSQNPGIRLTWSATLTGLWLIVLVHMNTSVQCQDSLSILYYIIVSYLCIGIFCFLSRFFYLSFDILYQNSNRMFTLDRFHIIFLHSL